MALPVELCTVNLFSDILRFLWTKQVDRAYDSEAALDCQETDCCLLEMGGLGIPHTDETIQGFRQNLIQKSLSNMDSSQQRTFQLY
jgi:hypothetical protein